MAVRVSMNLNGNPFSHQVEEGARLVRFIRDHGGLACSTGWHHGATRRLRWRALIP